MPVISRRTILNLLLTATDIIFYRINETDPSTKQAIVHTQTDFNPNKPYKDTAREVEDGKPIFRRNSTTYMNAGDAVSEQTKPTYIELNASFASTN